jgi:uncharacterized protein
MQQDQHQKRKRAIKRVGKRMRMSCFKRLFFAISGLLLLSMPMLVEATEKGLFWQMTSPSGQISYLFGTIHTDDNRVTDFSTSIVDALKQVDLFVMETQPNSNPSNFMMKDGSLRDMLTEAEVRQVRVLTDFHVMHLDYALRMKPWLLAVVFSQSKPQTPYAQDNLLMRNAEDFGKPVQGLETSQEHFGIIDEFTLDDQLVMLRAALKMTEAQKEKDFERLMSVYLKEDSDALLVLDADMTGAGLPKALWQRLRVKLLDERNDLMAERAIDLAKNQSVFIAVGAAHLAGENGLIHAFKKAGYQLSALKK